MYGSRRDLTVGIRPFDHQTRLLMTFFADLLHVLLLLSQLRLSIPLSFASTASGTAKIVLLLIPVTKWTGMSKTLHVCLLRRKKSPEITADTTTPRCIRALLKLLLLLLLLLFLLLLLLLLLLVEGVDLLLHVINGGGQAMKIGGQAPNFGGQVPSLVS